MSEAIRKQEREGIAAADAKSATFKAAVTAWQAQFYPGQASASTASAPYYTYTGGQSSASGSQGPPPPPPPRFGGAYHPGPPPPPPPSGGASHAGQPPQPVVTHGLLALPGLDGRSTTPHINSGPDVGESTEPGAPEAGVGSVQHMPPTWQ